MKTTGTFLLFGFAILIWCSSCGPDLPAPDSQSLLLRSRPNILWLSCEDISPLLAMFGDSTAKMPNLDQLAARGIRFPNTFSVAGARAPSRNCITTGMYPISIGGHHLRTQGNLPRLQKIGLPGSYGALPPPEVKMMSQVLREAGYFTSNNQKTDYQFQSLKTGWDEQGTKAHWRHRHDPTQPFFSIFNMAITHESQVWTTGKDQLRFRPGFEEKNITNDEWPALVGADGWPRLTVDPASVPLPSYLVDDAATRTDVGRWTNGSPRSVTSAKNQNWKWFNAFGTEATRCP